MSFAIEKRRWKGRKWPCNLLSKTLDGSGVTGSPHDRWCIWGECPCSELLVLTVRLRGQRLSELLDRWWFMAEDVQSPLLGHHSSLLYVLITLLISVNKCHPLIEVIWFSIEIRVSKNNFWPLMTVLFLLQLWATIHIVHTHDSCCQ